MKRACFSGRAFSLICLSASVYSTALADESRLHHDDTDSRAPSKLYGPGYSSYADGLCAGCSSPLDFGVHEPRRNASDTAGSYAVAQSQDEAETQAQDPGEPPADDEDPPTDKRLGEPPEATFREIFLRQASVLTQPGDIQVELALQYQRDEFVGAISNRLFQFAATVRAGLPYGLEPFVTVPFRTREQEISADIQTEARETGIGDITAGLSYVLLQESAALPNVIGQVQYSEPTGEDLELSDAAVAFLGANSDLLIRGRRSVSGALTFVRSTDPAALFGGILYRYVFSDSVSGVELEGGHQYLYRAGMGFAVNDQLTFSGLFTGVFQTEIEAGDTTVDSQEPMTLQFGITYAFTPAQYVEPSVTFGLNEDAADAFLNIAYVITF